jgi:hypothetical protein
MVTESESTRIARVLIDGALNDGGASIWQGERADHGYLVGIPGNGYTLPVEIIIKGHGPVALSHVAEWVERTRRDIAATWGSWLDADTGIVYFDISSHHANRETAATVCANRGEIAFWDVAENVECRP